MNKICDLFKKYDTQSMNRNEIISTQDANSGTNTLGNTVTVGIDPRTGKAYTAFPNMDKGYKQENQLLDFIKK